MAAAYTIVGQVQRSKFDPALQQAVEGWDVTVRWGEAGQVFTVFVPDSAYNPTNVDAAVRQQGATIDQVAALGAASVSSPRSA